MPDKEDEIYVDEFGQRYGFQTKYDIPRDKDGMKFDWELPAEFVDGWDQEKLESHIAKLIEEQSKDNE